MDIPEEIREFCENVEAFLDEHGRGLTEQLKRMAITGIKSILAGVTGHTDEWAHTLPEVIKPAWDAAGFIYTARQLAKKYPDDWSAYIEYLNNIDGVSCGNWDRRSYFPIKRR